MAVEADTRVGLGGDGAVAAARALAELARAGAALAEASSLSELACTLAEVAARATGADVAVARVAEPERQRLVARGVWARSAALAAELDGSALALADGPADELDQGDDLPAGLRSAAERAGAEGVLQLPARVRGELVGTLELLRSSGPFGEEERQGARLAAAQLAAALQAFRDDRAAGEPTLELALELVGEALAGAADEGRIAAEIVRVAAEATGARSSVLWRVVDEELRPEASFGEPGVGIGAAWARPLAERALAESGTVSVRDASAGDESEPPRVVAVQLGRPPVALLQLVFPAGAAPEEDEALARLATFGVRVAHALRAGERTRRVRLELDRTRALLAVVAQANAELSLSHTLETVVERVAELLGIDRVAVYLVDERRLVEAASRGLDGPHLAVAQRLLELALGPFRGRGLLQVEHAAADARLRGLDGELGRAGIEAAIALPLTQPDEVTGLLAVYPPRGRTLTENEAALVSALAAQLAVSVQNARLHEQATQLGSELESVLALERQAARQLRSLYEISRSFAQSLSLETTLEAVARTVVELLELDAAVIRMPDARGELLVPRAIHVADDRAGAALRAILTRPQSLERLAGRRLLRSGRALVLDPEIAARIGPPTELLVPFLRKGSTAAVLPIATPNELLGTLKLISLDPERPITAETLEVGLSVAAQAALAIDNARLYQHQKEFADTMQRSLLPRSQPQLPGIELGEHYESSARVDVGGDVYDYLTLDDGRLAVVLGDVTGHGIDAAADMAMAKFVFRSLAREHPEPGEFLAAANDVVCGEIAVGKFITMLYLTIDPATGAIACASAGHPQPRVVLPDGTVGPIPVRGLALGIEPGQEYEEAHERLPAGASVVLYTDGVIEARRAGVLYGSERLDAVLADRRDSPSRVLASAVVDDCRAFNEGDLGDDCAVVVIKRTAA